MLTVIEYKREKAKQIESRLRSCKMPANQFNLSDYRLAQLPQEDEDNDTYRQPDTQEIAFSTEQSERIRDAFRKLALAL